MCLLTYQKEPIILKEDRVVWKTLHKDLTTVYYNFKYELNTLYKESIKFSSSSKCYDNEQSIYQTEDKQSLKKGVFSISEDFHAFCDEKYIDIIIERYDSYPFHKFKCIIPAGSEYYEDETGLCVSNQIIIVEKVD